MPDPFKFIHASDLHLDRPMQGLPELPERHQRCIANAPYTAAQRIFDLAIAERVDFVLLCGDLLDIEEGGCRPAAFLLSQFQRLAERKIPVFWCGGEVDHPERWPAAVDLPGNVVLFCSSIVEESMASRDGRPLATIVGSGYDPRRKNSTDFLVDEGAPYPIGMTFGSFEPNALTAKHVRYWALGGHHRAQCVDRPVEQGSTWYVYSGTAQARTPREVGVHGCQVVQVDSAGSTRVTFHPVDCVRWLPQSLEIAESATPDQIKTALTECALKLLSDHADVLLLVNWRIVPTGAFHPRLRNSHQLEELLTWMRREFSTAHDEGLWSVDLRIDPPAHLPDSWREEDTILGDYLRAIERYRDDASLNLALHEYLPSTLGSDALTAAARLVGDERQGVLGDAAMTGIEYLAAGRETRD